MSQSTTRVVRWCVAVLFFTSDLLRCTDAFDISARTSIGETRGAGLAAGSVGWVCTPAGVSLLHTTLRHWDSPPLCDVRHSGALPTPVWRRAAQRNVATGARMEGATALPRRELRLESVLQQRIEDFLRIPPVEDGRLVNTTGRISPQVKRTYILT